jgi:hypothetical protein
MMVKQISNISSVKLRILLCVGLLGCGAEVSAHGGVALEFDKCISKMGKYEMHFTAYMSGEGTEYCWDIPRAGKAILVFDLWQTEMRTKPIEVRVVETAEEGDVGQSARTLAHLEPKNYPTGTISVDANFEQGKKYMAVVTISDTRPMVLKAPIRIAEGGGGTKFAMIGGLLLIGGAVGFLKWKKII